MSQSNRVIEPGNIVTFAEPTKAYNGMGSGYMVSHGHQALILDINEYDMVFYSCGEVLYCSPDTELFLPNY